jgi:hypothetical protein
MTNSATPLDAKGLEALGAELQKGIAHRADPSDLSVMPTQQEQVEGEWKRVVAAMRQCQLRLARHPKVPFFSVSRDEKEISVKINDGTPRGGYIVLTRNHPSGKEPSSSQVWLSDMGQPEKACPSPAEGMSQLLQRIAARLG